MPIRKNDTELINTATGEIINAQELINVYDDEVINLQERNKKELSEMGLLSDIQLKFRKINNKEYILVPIKKSYDFNKIFRVELREFMKKKLLSKNSRCIIGTLSSFISFPSNAVLYEGVYPTYEMLLNLIGMSKSTFVKTLKELEYFDIIKREKVGRDSIIYFNPFLISSGFISKHTYMLFKESAYNPYKG